MIPLYSLIAENNIDEAKYYSQWLMPIDAFLVDAVISFGLVSSDSWYCLFLVIWGLEVWM